jgi:hypothetical protein
MTHHTDIALAMVRERCLRPTAVVLGVADRARYGNHW